MGSPYRTFVTPRPDDRDVVRFAAAVRAGSRRRRLAGLAVLTTLAGLTLAPVGRPRVAPPPAPAVAVAGSVGLWPRHARVTPPLRWTGPLWVGSPPCEPGEACEF